MIKLNVMYPYSEGARFDHAYYCDKHMPMVAQKMLQRAMGASAKEIMADVPNYTSVQPLVWVSEVVVDRP